MEDRLNLEGFGQCPLPITEHETVQLAHGSGGRMMGELIKDLLVWAFSNPELEKLGDSAVLKLHGKHIAFSTDTFVVDPIFFPGGNIGELAVNGTVNDLSMSGARPVTLSVGLILEEGLPLDQLKEIVLSMRQAADRAGVVIVTGDTKVVPRGKADRIFINTSGVGVIESESIPSVGEIRSGDRILLSGTIGDHGMAIMSRREGLAFESSIESDTAPLNHLVEKMLEVDPASVHALRDPTRGGLATALNEFAEGAQVGIEIEEAPIPVRDAVRGACELLGLDPLYVANEGKLLAVVAPEAADEVLQVMRKDPLGEEACVIGRVVDRHPGIVSLKTGIAGERIVDMLVGEQLPRIC